MTDVLQGPFDVETHKRSFTNYLEAVVLADGTVEYAVPSHQEKLKRVMRESGRDPEGECPREFWADYLTWLMNETGCVCLWSNGYMGEPNARQRQAILRLATEGLVEVKRMR